MTWFDENGMASFTLHTDSLTKTWKPLTRNQLEKKIL